jgi:hypothetical protein
MSDGYVPDDYDVLALGNWDSFIAFNEKPRLFCQVKRDIDSAFSTDQTKNWLKGTTAKLLSATAGGGWQPGTIRVSLSIEFIPDEPEPPQQAQLEDSEMLFLPGSEDA